jgi:hypothetical protein
MQSFATLLEDLFTIAANRIRPLGGPPAFNVITTPTATQRQALEMLTVPHRIGYAQAGSLNSSPISPGRRSIAIDQGNFGLASWTMQLR